MADGVCGNCDTLVHLGQRFCPGCGHGLVWPDEARPGPPGESEFLTQVLPLTPEPLGPAEPSDPYAGHDRDRPRRAPTTFPRRRGVVALAAAVVVVLGLGVAAYLVLRPTADVDRAGPGTTSDAAGRSGTGQATDRRTEPTTGTAASSAPGAPDWSDPDWPEKANSEADLGGWKRPGGLRCTGDRSALFLLETTSFRIVVCGGAADPLQYRSLGLAKGGGLTVVDGEDGDSITSTGGGYQVVRPDGTTYTVSDSGLTVEVPGTPATAQPAVHVWP